VARVQKAYCPVRFDILFAEGNSVAITQFYSVGIYEKRTDDVFTVFNFETGPIKKLRNHAGRVSI